MLRQSLDSILGNRLNFLNELNPSLVGCCTKDILMGDETTANQFFQGAVAILGGGLSRFFNVCWADQTMFDQELEDIVVVGSHRNLSSSKADHK